MNKIIYLAGGCFWGMQGYFDKIKGTVDTEVGYLNGSSEITTYKQVCNNSGHAEVIKLTYDNSILLEQDIFFLYMRVINPFSINEQGEDKGIQYRTGIYSDDPVLLNTFVELLEKWESKNDKSAIEIEKVINYCKAELSHQKYLENNIGGYCHINLHNIPIEFKK